MITHKELLKEVTYNPETGEFWWLKSSPGRQAFTRAGSVGYTKKNNYKYRRIHFSYESYLEARLAWFYVYKKWPTHLIYHINGDTLDNSFSNLRELNHSQNIRRFSELRSSNNSGFTGVCWDKDRARWQAYIKFEGRTYKLGRYEDKQDAIDARLAGEKKYCPQDGFEIRREK